MDSIGKNLKECRKKKGIKRTDFAKNIGITYSAACKYESDLRMPSVEVLVKMADLLEVSTDQLLGRKMDQGSHSSWIESI